MARGVWKRAITSALRSVTGYELQRVGRGSGPVAVEVKPRTMTSNEKLYALVQAARYVVQHDIPGDIVECGVWRGGSMQAVALTLLEQGATDRHLHLFDTFEGMPPPTEKDRRYDDVAAERLLATHERDSTLWAIAGVDEVQAAMREVDYPPSLIHFHKGLVEHTIPAQAPDQISILRLDTDWYESTRHELEHLYDRLSPGGVLIIDDYGYWAGARMATEAFLEQTGEPLLMLPLSTGRIAVKPLR
jgi:O-methyltransferase